MERRVPVEDVLRFRRNLKALYQRIAREQPVIDGLSSPALQMLVMIARAPTPLRPSQLASELHITNSNVAAGLRLLESRKLVVMTRDARDGRKAYVELTELGKPVVSEITESFNAWLQDAIDTELGPDERDVLLRAGELMRRLADRK